WKNTCGLLVLERTDRHVISVRIPERELHCLRIRVQVRLLFKFVDQRARSLQRHVIVIDAEEQEEPVARRRFGRAHQGRVIMLAPSVKAEQGGPIRVQDLTKVIMTRRRLGLAEERLVPFEASWNIAHPDDRPDPFHRSLQGTYSCLSFFKFSLATVS